MILRKSRVSAATPSAARLLSMAAFLHTWKVSACLGWLSAGLPLTAETYIVWLVLLLTAHGAPRSEESEMEYWLGVLQAQIPTVMEKATASEDHSKGTLFAAFQVKCSSTVFQLRDQSACVCLPCTVTVPSMSSWQPDAIMSSCCAENGTATRASGAQFTMCIALFSSMQVLSSLARPHRGAAAGGGVRARVHRAHRQAADVAARLRGAGPGRPLRDARGVPPGVRLRGRVQVSGYAESTQAMLSYAM